MDCKEINSLITEYLDDTLSAKQKKAMEAHLANCSACRREITTYRNIQVVIQEIGKESVSAPAGFTGKVMAALEKETLKPKRKLAWLANTWRKGVAAAAVFLLVAGSAAAGFNSEFRVALTDKIFGSKETPEIVELAVNTINPFNPIEGETTGLGSEDVDTGQLTENPEIGTSENNPSVGIQPVTPEGTELSTGDPVENITPVDSSNTAASELPPLVLLSEGTALIATSTNLRITTGDLSTGKTQATTLAVAAGATVQAFPEQPPDADGKKTMLIKLTVPTKHAPLLIAELSALGEVQKRTDDRKDLKARYDETKVDYYDIVERLTRETNQSEKQRLKAQADSYKQQLDAWNEEINNQVISLWLESSD